MDAVQARFEEGARSLLTYNAQVDKANGSGETPLIRAVQLRDVGLVRLLVAQGANPDRRDTIAGMSARDYAQRDNPTPGLAEAQSGRASCRERVCRTIRSLLSLAHTKTKKSTN